MNKTQARAVAAMRAIGNTVTAAPPLRLPPRPVPSRSPGLAWPGSASGRGWRQWLIPAAAAVTVVVIAISLVVVRSVVRGDAAAPGNITPPGSVPTTSGQGTGTVPRYDVSLPADGWYAYAPLSGSTAPYSSDGLVISSTATGRQLATVPAPKGLAFNVVSGAADDRTFVAGAVASSSKPDSTASTLETWFLLRLSPGTAHVARLTALPVLPTFNVTGVALSPDGSKLAVSSVSMFGASTMPKTRYPGLSVYSTATGKSLRVWGAAGGEITASAPTGKYESDAANTGALATALRWTADGGQLAFAWNGAMIRLLDLGSAKSVKAGLLQASTLRAVIGTGSTPAGSSSTCVAAAGRQLSADATTFTCADSYVPSTAGGCPKSAPAHPAFLQEIRLSNGATELNARIDHSACTSANLNRSGTSLGWASADGSTDVGRLGGSLTGQLDEYGIFTGGKFSRLPAPLNGESPVDVGW